MGAACHVRLVKLGEQILALHGSAAGARMPQEQSTCIVSSTCSSIVIAQCSS
jgi:hypothetical protein